MKLIGMLDFLFVCCVVILVKLFDLLFEYELILVFCYFEWFRMFNLVVKVLMFVIDGGVMLFDLLLIVDYFDYLVVLEWCLLFDVVEVWLCVLVLIGFVLVVVEKIVQVVYEQVLCLLDKQYELWVDCVLSQFEGVYGVLELLVVVICGWFGGV